MHEARGEERPRVKHIARCATAIAAGGTCHVTQHEEVHILEEDEPDELCQQCKGETPPETP
jgi:hypothetical protein